MVSNVDMSLDSFIKAKKIKPNRGGRGGQGGRGGRGKQQGRGGSLNRGGQRGRGRGGQRGAGRGGQRGGFKQNFQNVQRQGVFTQRPVQQISTGPAKIQLTNLDFGVSDSDVKELFAEFGSLKMAAIHYNAQGRSMGTATLVYARRADAIKAIKQYNGVALDGRTMNLRLEGEPLSAGPAGFTNTSPLKRLGRGAFGVRGARGGNRGARGGNRGAKGGAQGKFVARGAKAGRGGTRGRGGNKGRGGKAAKPKPKTAEELDAELDAYIQTKV